MRCQVRPRLRFLLQEQALLLLLLPRHRAADANSLVHRATARILGSSLPAQLRPQRCLPKTPSRQHRGPKTQSRKTNSRSKWSRRQKKLMHLSHSGARQTCLRTTHEAKVLLLVLPHFQHSENNHSPVLPHFHHSENNQQETPCKAKLCIIGMFIAFVVKGLPWCQPNVSPSMW